MVNVDHSSIPINVHAQRPLEDDNSVSVVSPLGFEVHIVYIPKRSVCFLLILLVFSNDSQAICIKLVYDRV
jgi:hypothetical protein